MRNKPTLDHLQFMPCMLAVKLTTHCLEFLIKVGSLLPESTVGFSPDEEFDVLVVTPNELKWISRSKLPRDT